MDLWQYRARPTRVVDGDTIDVLIDVGFDIAFSARLRVLGVDTPEMRGDEREAGLIAKTFVEDWCQDAAQLTDSDWPLIVVTEEADSFGRWLARVYDTASEELAVELIEAELGEVYDD